MGETIQRMKEQLNEFWGKIEKSKKKKIIIISIIVVLVILVASIAFTRTKYDVLYGELSLKDMGQITKKLDEMGVEWKTPSKDDPTTILVPANMKNKIKIELASYGLPKEGYSFMDAFSDSSWTMTDYDKKQRMQLALQNELAATISEIDGIENATVYINEKEGKGFVLEENDKETTASVSVTKSDNKPLKAEAVIAIQNLVASSINTEQEKVQIIDNQGKLLTSEGNETDILMGDQFNIKDSLETRIDDSIKRFLENIFAYGNVDVRSSVKINFDSERTSIVEFAPPIEGNDEGLLRSMEEIEEHMVGGSEGGIAGTESNPPEYEMIEDGNERYDKVSRTINNELNEINKEIQKTPGEIETITVAVLINEDALSDGEFTPDKEKEIADLIYAATGLDTKQVEVKAERFKIDDLAGEKDGKKSKVWWWVLGLVLIAIAGAVGYFMYKRNKERELEELQMGIEDATAMTAEVEDLNFDTEESKMKSQVGKFVDKKPDAVAQLLKTWLNE